MDRQCRRRPLCALFRYECHNNARCSQNNSKHCGRKTDPQRLGDTLKNSRLGQVWDRERSSREKMPKKCKNPLKSSDFSGFMDEGGKIDLAVRLAPKTESEPSAADPIWKGGARERSGWNFLQKNAGAKRTLLRRGPSGGI